MLRTYLKVKLCSLMYSLIVDRNLRVDIAYPAIFFPISRFIIRGSVLGDLRLNRWLEIRVARDIRIIFASAEADWLAYGASSHVQCHPLLLLH